MLERRMGRREKTKIEWHVRKTVGRTWGVWDRHRQEECQEVTVKRRDEGLRDGTERNGKVKMV